MKRIVILGGGTGGTLVANRLRRVYHPGAVEIVVADRDGDHVYQPGLLFVPFGRADVRRITRPRWRQLRSGIVYCQASDRPRRRRARPGALRRPAIRLTTTS